MPACLVWDQIQVLSCRLLNSDKISCSYSMKIECNHSFLELWTLVHVLTKVQGPRTSWCWKWHSCINMHHNYCSKQCFQLVSVLGLQYKQFLLSILVSGINQKPCFGRRLPISSIFTPVHQQFGLIF